MSDFFDREGRPLELFEWAKLYEDPDYKQVRQDYLPGGIRISTAWLGCNYNFSVTGLPPIIFETMIFLRHEPEDYIRYSTEEAARAGHAYLLVCLLISQKYDNQLPE